MEIRVTAQELSALINNKLDMPCYTQTIAQDSSPTDFFSSSLVFLSPLYVLRSTHYTAYNESLNHSQPLLGKFCNGSV